MSLITTFVAGVALLLCGKGLGAPLPNPSLDLVQRNVPADDISKYSVTFFLNNVKQKPDRNGCVFYSQGQSKAAQDYADVRMLDTIWAVWSEPGDTIGDTGCGLYNGITDDQNNPLREIMADPKIRFIYFSHMSEAYAELCSGDALLMSATPKEVPQDGIWFNTEFATLTKTTNVGGVVNLVTVIDPQGGGAAKYWGRESSKTKRGLEDSRELFERANKPTTCLTAQQIEDTFGDINW